MREQDTIAEEWRPVVGYEGRYEVSDHGRVRRFHSGGGCHKRLDEPVVMRPFKTSQGYRVIRLSSAGQKTSFSVHRLVLFAFVGPCPDDHECAHWNGTRDDNRLENLRWATRQENHQDKVRMGRVAANHGEDCPNTSLKEAQVVEMRTLYAEGGVTHQDLADRYGVSSKSVVGRIINGKRWIHAGGPLTTHRVGDHPHRTKK